MRVIGQRIVNFAPEGEGGAAVPPASGAAPAAGDVPAAGTPPAQGIARPEWLPEDQWDTTSNAIKPEFGTHYGELKTFFDAEQARKAALPQKPEDIKFDDVKLPEGITAPDGMEIKINPDDPRIPVIRDMAIKRGWDQDTVNELVALDARMQIEGHNAEMQRIAAEDAKLGSNAKDRKEAVGNWLRGLKDRDQLSAEEFNAVRVYAIDAAAVTALEKIMAMASGSVPGDGGRDPATKPAEVPQSERWYGSTTPKKVI
jgi:hypothetical protein